MKKLYTLVVALYVCTTIFAQSVFDNPITDPNPSTVNPFTAGQTVNPNLTVSGIGRGPGITGTGGLNRYNANSWNTASIDFTAYFEFTITPNAGQAVSFISFVYTGERSGSGPNSFAFRTSLDGFTTDVGTPTATGATINLSAPQYQNVSSAITFRIYAWAAGGAAGTFSINDFTYNGVTSVLPVNLEYFSGAKLSNALSLNWKANCSGASNVDFAIERSTDGRRFTTINNFAASAVRCQQPFEFSDNSAAAGKNYYRIKVTEDNGKTFYSSIIVLLNATDGFDIAAVLPTVVTSSAVLNISAAKKTQATIIITDYAGRKQQQQVYSLVAGSNQLLINTAGLASGTYNVTGITTAGQTATVRFVKQ
jgi:hypothetical protein